MFGGYHLVPQLPEGVSSPELEADLRAREAAAVAAFKAAAEALLKDESMMGLCAFIRPVRAPPAHQPDAAQKLAELPEWCRRALAVPFTQVRGRWGGGRGARAGVGGSSCAAPLGAA